MIGIRYLVLVGFVLGLTLGSPAIGAGQSRLGPVVGVIGVAEGPTEQVFGEISDVEAIATGYFAVVDGLWKEVRVFGPSLEHVATLGRSGNGPEEFAGTALSAGVDTAGVLVIADPRNLRLTRISLGSSPKFLGSVRVAVPPTSLCTSAGRTFIWHIQGDQVIGEVSADGEVAVRFGQREVATSNYFSVLRGSDYFLNQADLGCAAEGPTVVAAHQFHPVVQAYSFDGMPLWRVELADYRQQVFRRIPDGGCCAYLIPNAQTGTYHVGLEALTPGDGYAYVSLRESGGETREGQYEVRIVRLSDGQEVGRFPSSGVLSAVSGGRAYVIEPYPVPRVWVHEWHGIR